MLENIELKDVNLGYRQCKELSDLVTKEGEKILGDLSATVVSLQKNWVGADATVHINNLIDVRDSLNDFVGAAKKITSATGACIIDVQNVIRANGGATEVGDPLPSTIASVSSIAKLDTTTEFRVDPAASNDYTDLENECSAYQQFVDKFSNLKDQLFANWIKGAGKEDAVKCFNQFLDESVNHKKMMDDAKNNLSTAISNISQLG